MIPGVTKKEELLHAYLFEGEGVRTVEELTAFLSKKLRILVVGNPDVHIRQLETLTIEEGRTLKGLASEQSFGESPKIFIISFHAVTREAQNALLKLFEEPTAATHFFLIVPSTEILLPTLRSRLMIVHRNTQRGSETSTLGREFLAADGGRRLELTKSIVETKDKKAALELMNELEQVLYEKLTKGKAKKEIAAQLAAIQGARQYIHDRAPSVKMLLEHLSTTL